MSEPIRQGAGPTGVLAGIALAVVLVAGAWWTGTAVAEGRALATAVRFFLSIGVGVYYLGLLRLIQGHRILSDR